MNKSQLSEALAREFGLLTNKEAKLCVDTFFETMAETLAERQRIEIRGFGSFKVKEYQPYKGRNPKTGKLIQVTGKKLPLFKMSSQLRKRVNNK